MHKEKPMIDPMPPKERNPPGLYVRKGGEITEVARPTLGQGEP